MITIIKRENRKREKQKKHLSQTQPHSRTPLKHTNAQVESENLLEKIALKMPRKKNEQKQKAHVCKITDSHNDISNPILRNCESTK